MIRKILRWWRRRRFSRPGELEVVGENRLQEMFLNVPDTPGWKATLAQLDMEVEDAVEESLHENLTNDQLRWRLGGAAYLLRFKQVLLERERDAREKQSEAAGE